MDLPQARFLNSDSHLSDYPANQELTMNLQLIMRI
jgi:hypothetical protein